MKWAKKGLVYAPEGDLWWAKSHAYLPTADVISDQCIRVYFASWDKDRIGRVGYVELDIDDPGKLLYLTKECVLDIGEYGTFDDCGVSPCCIVTTGSKKRLYYFGWQKTLTAPYLLFCGVAISLDGGKSFTKYSKVPVLDRTDKEYFLRSATAVLEEDGLFRMWYVCGVDWTEFNGKPCPSYVIKYTESPDGLNWNSASRTCIDFESEDEFGFGGPCVIQDGGTYRMWYSIRSKIRPYRMGYAESVDGLEWVRKDDEVGIETSETGWDSEMICFPSVVQARGKTYMFYNGNRHGETGFGYAELVQE